jgi:hypothetical protein
MYVTYCVGCGVFLLGTDDGAAAHGCVQGALALDNSLTGAAAAADLAANLGDGFPIVRHLEGFVVVVVMVIVVTCCVWWLGRRGYDIR